MGGGFYELNESIIGWKSTVNSTRHYPLTMEEFNAARSWVLVKLSIEGGTIVHIPDSKPATGNLRFFSASKWDHLKMRCEAATVLGQWSYSRADLNRAWKPGPKGYMDAPAFARNLEQNPLPEQQVEWSHSDWDIGFTYRVGHVVRPNGAFDMGRGQCKPGIHFFGEEEAALLWLL